MNANIKIRVMYYKSKHVQTVLKRCGNDMKKAMDFKINYNGPLDKNRIYTEVVPRVRRAWAPLVRRMKKVS